MNMLLLDDDEEVGEEEKELVPWKVTMLGWLDKILITSTSSKNSFRPSNEEEEGSTNNVFIATAKSSRFLQAIKISPTAPWLILSPD